MGTKSEDSLDKAGGCFGCGSGNLRGLKLVFRRRDHCVVAETRLDASLAGYDGLVHGGIVATLLDEAMGWALLELAGRYGVTRSLNIQYRRPVAVGRALEVSAHIVEGTEAGPLWIEASVRDSRGRLLASAMGEWVLVRDSRVRSRSASLPPAGTAEGPA